MGIAFTKMHGLGNDFVVLDNRSGTLAHLTGTDFRQLADRHLGVGCDQILMIVDCATGPVYRVLNADGTEVGQCGNGARCVARWLFDQGAIARQAVLGSPAGSLKVAIGDQGQVAVHMGRPRFEPAALPLDSEQPGPAHRIEVGGNSLELLAVSMGNPHAVLVVDRLDQASVQELGQALQSHPRFPQQVNVGFAQVLGEQEIGLRVYERGVGETRACGTGACAAVVCLIQSGRLAPGTVKVNLPGGQLAITWPGGNGQVEMSGPAEYVFEGTYAPR